MTADAHLPPGWSEELQHILDEEICALRLPSRTAGSLEAAGVLTVRDLLLRSLDELAGIPSFGDKSFNLVKQALYRKGFRRARGRYDSSKPLYTLYKDCKGRRAQPSEPYDLVTETPTIEGCSRLLTHKQALERAVSQLEILRTHFGKTGKYADMLNWIIYYAKTRLPEPDDT